MPDGRPLPRPIIYAAAGAGHAPVVKAYDAESAELKFAIAAYEPSFPGGVRVGTGDFNGDGIPDVVTAPGPDHAPVIKVFDSQTGTQLASPVGSFLAYSTSVTGGVHVAAADVDGDHKPDILTSALTGFGPRIKVFNGVTGSVIADFVVSGLTATNGLTIAAADLTGDGKAEVVVGAGMGGDGWVRTYDPLTGTIISGPLGNFQAFGANYGGGVYVGSDALAADVDGDGTLDLAVGTRGAVQSRVRVFSGSSGMVLHDFLPFGAGVSGGARVGLAYVNDDAHADMVVGVGPGNTASVRVFDGSTGSLLAPPLGEYSPFGTDTVGVFVAASNDPELTGSIYGDFTAYVGGSTGDLVLGDALETDGNTDAGQYTVSIDWGDGTNSLGWLVYTGDDGMGQVTYTIHGVHTYTEPSGEMSPFTVSVRVDDTDGDWFEGTVSATVYDTAPPPRAIITADIDIDGFNETTEDNPGGLVVRRAAGNNAPRKKIIIQQIPGWTGDVLFTQVSGALNVKVFDAATGGTQITFNGTDNKYANANLPKTLYVQGDWASDDMRDTVLKAEPIIVNPNEQGVADTVSFTVLWVDVGVSFTGSVSADNDKADTYKNSTTAKTYALGLQTFDNGTDKWWGWGYEAWGRVSPSTFDYPGNDLKLERDRQQYWYKGTDPLGTAVEFSASIPPGNDTGPAAWRDDNPLDSDPLGSIYDLDYPGIYMVTSPQNEIRRVRFNFKEFASITVDGTLVRASDIFSGFVRFSIKQTTAPTGSTWVTTNDVAGDNDAGTGVTKVTWDLK